jgi:hypothetical protein
MIRRQVPDNCEHLAELLLDRIDEAYRRCRRVRLDGELLDVRLFAVDGSPTIHLHRSSMPVFMRALRKALDRSLERQVMRLPH